jgi:hypothetical protein
LLLAQLTFSRSLHRTTFAITAQSPYIPYKGAVVINGVLYCPYSITEALKAQREKISESRKPKHPPTPNPTPTAKMQGANFGALGATFTVVRAMEAISLITIIGMSANFVAEMVAVNQAPPPVLIGTLSVVCFLVTHSFNPALTKRRPVLASSTSP